MCTYRVYASLCVHNGVYAFLRWYTAGCMPPYGGIPQGVCLPTVVYLRVYLCAEWSLSSRVVSPSAQSGASLPSPVRVNVSNCSSTPGFIFPFHCWIFRRSLCTCAFCSGLVGLSPPVPVSLLDSYFPLHCWAFPPHRQHPFHCWAYSAFPAP